MDRPSNRSPSPLSIRQNPNLRNSESRSDVRRSFNGSPFGDRSSTLTNPRLPNSITPADHLRRHSSRKEGDGVNSRVHDEKENEKAAQVRLAPKGSKNFMSPTISAASKFTPSPGKKVLAEKNEIVRTSIQFSGSQDSILMEDSCSKRKKMSRVKTEASLDLKVDQKEVIVEVPLVPQVNLDSDMTKNSGVSCTKKKTVSFSDISTIIAPLDADPSQSPYDPNTNFLSPRPQFLNYKPNARIEVFLKKDIGFDYGECDDMRLDDSVIMSGESESEDSLKESEDLSSSETISDKDEHIPVSTPKLEPTLEAKISSKPRRFFTKAKFISLLLVFLIACLSVYVIDSLVLDSYVLKDASLSRLYDPSEVARSFRQLPANSIVYFAGLVRQLCQPNDFGPIQFVNLTGFPPQGDLIVDPYVGVDLDEDDELEEIQEEEEWEMASEEQGVDEVENSTIVEEQPFLEPKVTKIVEEAELVDVKPEVKVPEIVEDEVESGTIVEDQPFLEPQVAEIVEEMESVDVKPEVKVPEIVEDEVESGTIVEDQPFLEPQVAEIEEEMESVNGNPEVDVPEISDVSPEFVASDLTSHAENDQIIEVTKVELSSEIAPSEQLSSAIEDTKVELSFEITPSDSKPMPSTLNATSYKFSPQNMMEVPMLVFSIAAAIVFIHFRQRKNASSVGTQELSKKPIVIKQVSQNWEAEVDIEAESSCPSEMSSFQKSSSYTKRALRMETNEAQSQEKTPRRTNYKRESLASSSDFSMGSLSYGSFTTYERIPIKTASGEEEIVTPVRRSSRIRSHVTSP